MAKYGVEYEGFSSLVLKIENLGVSMNEVADKVLDEVAPLASAHSNRTFHMTERKKTVFTPEITFGRVKRVTATADDIS